MSRNFTIPSKTCEVADTLNADTRRRSSTEKQISEQEHLTEIKEETEQMENECLSVSFPTMNF